MKIPFGKPLIDSKERMAVQKVLSGEYTCSWTEDN